MRIPAGSRQAIFIPECRDESPPCLNQAARRQRGLAKQGHPIELACRGVLLVEVERVPEFVGAEQAVSHRSIVLDARVLVPASRSRRLCSNCSRRLRRRSSRSNVRSGPRLDTAPSWNRLSGVTPRYGSRSFQVLSASVFEAVFVALPTNSVETGSYDWPRKPPYGPARATSPTRWLLNAQGSTRLGGTSGWAAAGFRSLDEIDHGPDVRPVPLTSRVQLHGRIDPRDPGRRRRATPWSGYGWETDRITVTLSMTFAIRGRSSQTSRPGTFDGIDFSSPRISSGASGLGSKVSELAGRPVEEQEDTGLGLAELIGSRKRGGRTPGVRPLGPASPNPIRPSELTWSRSRRVIPLQKRFGPPRTAKHGHLGTGTSGREEGNQAAGEGQPGQHPFLDVATTLCQPEES